jgi:FkbM family methyltransferase
MQALISLKETIILAAVKRNNRFLYRAARQVANRYRGENNCDMATNGEQWLMSKTLPVAAVIFDVGANEGDWTAAATHLNHQGAYHCFEPSIATFEKLRERGLPTNVRLNNSALGQATGEVQLYVFGDTSVLNSFYPRAGLSQVAERVEEVSVTTLDDYALANSIDFVDFLKLDVEGHEYSVLRGAERMLRERRIGMIQLEYGGTQIDARVFLKDIFGLLIVPPCSYKAHKLFPTWLEPVERYSQDLDNFQYSNWVFVNPEIWGVSNGTPRLRARVETT